MKRLLKIISDVMSDQGTGCEVFLVLNGGNCEPSPRQYYVIVQSMLVPNNTTLQSQKAVSAYLRSKQILPFGFAWQSRYRITILFKTRWSLMLGLQLL